MRRAMTRIKQDIARLQDELRQAEAKQAERIGRLALRAGLGECQVDDEALLPALTTLAQTFRDIASTKPKRADQGASDDR